MARVNRGDSLPDIDSSVALVQAAQIAREPVAPDVDLIEQAKRERAAHTRSLFARVAATVKSALGMPMPIGPRAAGAKRSNIKAY
jgi:hypothetical protein